MWRHVSTKRRVQFGLLVILTLLASFAEMIGLAAVLPFLGALTNPQVVFDHPKAQIFIDYLEINKAEDLILPFTLMFAGTTVFAGLVRLTLLWAQTRLSHAVGADFSLEIYKRTLCQPYEVHTRRNTSDIIAGISHKTKTIVGSTVMPILLTMSALIIVITILSAVITFEPYIAVATISCLLAIYFLIALFTKSRLLYLGTVVSVKQTRLIKALQEGLGGIREVLMRGAHETFCKIYREADLPLRKASADIQIISSSPRFLIEIFGLLFISGLAYFLVTRTDNNSTAIPLLGALAMGAQRILPLFQQCYASWATIRGGQSSLSDALDLMDQPYPDNGLEPMRFEHSLLVKNLIFKYEAADTDIFSRLNIEIPIGSRLGVTGKTGCGKSTLTDLLMGLLVPTGGVISVDGVSITNANRRAWQLQVAHVPQNIFLLDGTITENVAFGASPEDIDMSRVEMACERAQISDVVNALPERYSSRVGERGGKLSGGQRQRIGIARALYQQSKVIILDEATSALDEATESDVMKAIESLGREVTVIIVAHRLSTLKKCDQVINLNDGEVLTGGQFETFIHTWHSPSMDESFD